MCAFEVKPEHMDAMKSNEAVDLIRELIYADAAASGIPYDKIDVPTAITSPDGGVDGVVRGAPKGGKHGIVKKGLTCYQIKSGKFRLSNIEKVLRNGGKLKDRIKSCLDRNGALIVAFTGWDGPDPTDNETENRIIQHLKDIDPRYAGASVEVWRQNTIVGFLRNFPSLRLKVRGMENAGFLHHEEWSEQTEMRRKFRRGKKQEEQIGEIRHKLRRSGPLHIRISGAPGIGKTRLIREATDTDDLRPLVVYVDNPSVLTGQGFLTSLGRSDDKSEIILVVDECNFGIQADLWDKLGRKKGVRLITIFNDPKEPTGTTEYLEVEGLDSAEMAQILQEHVADGQDLGEWVDFCGKSARVAHIVGENLKNNPEDVLAPPDTVDIWGRYIADSRVPHDSAEFEAKFSVMTWLSLFKRLEKGDVARVRGLLAAKGVTTEDKFDTVRKKMQDRKIVQGHADLYITPKALHVYLWIEWWKVHGSDMFPAKELDPAGGLLDRCMDMFEYAGQVPKAKEITAKLAEGGWLGNDCLGSHAGRRFFSSVGALDPSRALAFVEGLLGGKSREELLGFAQGRREVVRALERAARRTGCFDRAARLLRLLAEAENEGFSNNASGVFCCLFAPGHPGAGYRTRLDALDRAAAAGSKHGRIAAARACKKALESPTESWRAGGAGDAEYLGGVLAALARLASDPDADVAAEAAGAILENARFALHEPELSGAMMGALSAVRESGARPGELLEATSRVTEFGENLEPGILEGLRRMQDKIAGTGFRDRLKRYVGMPIHINEYTGADSQEARRAEIERLADEAREPSVLEPELGWLVTDEAKYAHRFGYELGRRDPGRALFQAMLGAISKPGGRRRGALVGGYLRAVRERDEAAWDAMMDQIYLEGARALLPEITRLSGVTASSMDRIIKAVRGGSMPHGALSVSKYSAGLPEPVVRECVEILLAGGGEEERLAAELLQFHFVKRRKPLPEDLALRALLHERMLDGTGEAAGAWEWGEVGSALARQSPGCAAKIAEAVLGAFGSSWPFRHPDAPPVRVLGEIAEAHPAETWGLLSPMIGPPSDDRARSIQAWLRRGAMSHMPIQRVLAWASEDESRAAHLAGFVPHDWNVVRELASAYGDRDDFKRDLSLNLDSESWTGSETDHYLARKKKIEDLEAGESDPRVREWLQYYLKQTERNLERARQEEERDVFDAYS